MNLGGMAIAVTRKAPGSYVDGRWVAGETSVFNIEANVQPLNGHELLQLSEGDRTREHKKTYTAFAIKNGDIVTLEDGLDYEANNVEDWSAHPQPHYKARITRVEEQD